MGIKNDEIAKILRELGGYYEIKNEPFKPRAYEKAAESIENADLEMRALFDASGEKGLLTVPGVGRGIAAHIMELLKTEHLKIYDRFKKQMPFDLSELTSIEGVGAKTVGVLYKKLKIKNLADLKKALTSGRLADLEGFGKKSAENIQKSLQTHAGGPRRYLLGEIYLTIERLRQDLEASGKFSRVVVGGSYRRGQETVGDIDILAIPKEVKPAMEYFVKYKDAARVLDHGAIKSAILLRSGIRVDLYTVAADAWGAAAQYFTGDLQHNIKMRKIAIDKKLKLSGQGLFRGKKNILKSGTEEEVYKLLGFKQMPPPEMRTDSGEIEAGIAGKLPKLIDYGDVRGDLQVQTSWTDGHVSIEDMAKAAQALGRQYIAITDHTKTLTVARGLDEKKIEKQGREIDKLNATLRLRSGSKSFRILKGVEVNILKDGSLDIADSTLKLLDVVGVSVHSHFNLARAEQTKRIIRAISNPHVDILFHPTTRILGKRGPIDYDFGAVLKAAKKYRVALEIDAHPWRLDLHDKLIRQAVDLGVKLTIDSDAHYPRELGYIHFGEAQARRGWAKKSDVLNTMNAEDLLNYFKK